MVHSYLKFDVYGATGVIASSTSEVAVLHQQGRKEGKRRAGPKEHVVASTLETVTLWDTKTRTVAAVCPVIGVEGDDALHPELTIERVCKVTALRGDPEENHLAVGYDNGRIGVVTYPGLQTVMAAKQHRSPVTTFAWAPDGAILASGSKDTHILLWDVTAGDLLCQFKGHVGPIMGLTFLPPSEPIDEQGQTGGEEVGQGLLLLSVAALPDDSLRVWDVEVRDCIQQVTTGVKDLSSLAVSPDRRRAVLGGHGKAMAVYSLEALPKGPPVECGALERHGGLENRVVTLRFHPSGLLGCHGSDKQFEVWRLLTEVEAKARNRRLKRRKLDRKAKKGAAGEGEGVGGVDEGDTVVGAAVEFMFLQSFTADHKIRSFDWLGDATGVALTTHRNTIELWHLAATLELTRRTASIDSMGHRTMIRCVAQSHDGGLMASGSTDGVMVWVTKTAKPCCTFPAASGHGAVALAFLPGDKFLIVGTNGGTLDIYSIPAATSVQRIEAHEAVTVLRLRPHSQGVVSVGSDRKLTMWDYATATIGEADRPETCITLKESNAMEFSETVLDVAYTGDAKRLVVAFHDSTIKVFFADTLKLSLSLYGHKLPVTSVSGSSDGELLVSGSMDKNLRLWGLTFGECRKTFHAHDGYITQVAFLPGTHHFFSASHDATVKYWDADGFILVQIIRSHVGPIETMAGNGDGSLIVTGGADLSIRAFFRSTDLVFPQEEKEKEMQRAMDAELLQRAGQEAGADALAGRRTLMSYKAAEELVAAVDLALHEGQQLRDATEEAPAKANPMLRGLTPVDYVMDHVSRIPAHELRHVVSLMSFDHSVRLLSLLHSALPQAGTIPGQPVLPTPKEPVHVETVARVSTAIIRHHYPYLAQQPALLPILTALRGSLRGALQAHADCIAFNQVAVQFVSRKMDDA